MANRKRYAIVGTGSRCGMFFKAVTDSHADVAELVGLCDLSRTRMDFYNGKLAAAGKPAVPTFPADQFDQMVRQTKPDKVIVTTRDCTHDGYITRAMDLGCDAITEKPMTTDEVKCRSILDAIARTGRKLTVTFNYRYAPKRSKVKEVLAAGTIGRVLSVHYEWLLDVNHGADYFRRWHRQKVNSGGLLVHKATHHFDLVNWWIDAAPARVFATGSLGFYGHANGNGPQGLSPFSGRFEKGDSPSGWTRTRGTVPISANGFRNGDSPRTAAEMGTVPERCHTCPVTGQCKFFLDLAASPNLKALYLDAEHDNGYVRDQCVFGEGITAEDNMAVSVVYDSGARMSYSLNAFMPWEGSRIMFNGTKGRLEFHDVERTYVSGKEPGSEGETLREGARITVFPQHAAAYDVPFETGRGGHGGGDTPLLDDVFRGASGDPLGRAADHVDGARSIMTGIAANHSIATGKVIDVADLIELPRR